MKQIHFGQRPSFRERAVEGGPGIRVGVQSGGEAGTPAAPGEEAVPSPAPPGLRGAVTLEASPGRANQWPWAGGPGPVWLRRRAPVRARLLRGPARLCGPGPWPPGRPYAPLLPGIPPGLPELRVYAVGQPGQKTSVTPSSTHPRSSDRNLLETRSQSLGFGGKNAASAPLPTRCLPAPRFGLGCVLAAGAPCTVPGTRAARPRVLGAASALLPDSIPIFLPQYPSTTR